jgi:protoheme IX farnesyltransferase
MLLYTIVLWPIALAPAFLGLTGAIYAVVAAVLSALFTLTAIRVCYDTGETSAKRMFGFSILYLFVLFAVMVVDRAPGLAGGVGMLVGGGS